MLVTYSSVAIRKSREMCQSLESGREVKTDTFYITSFRTFQKDSLYQITHQSVYNPTLYCLQREWLPHRLSPIIDEQFVKKHCDPWMWSSLKLRVWGIVLLLQCKGNIRISWESVIIGNYQQFIDFPFCVHFGLEGNHKRLQSPFQLSHH